LVSILGIDSLESTMILFQEYTQNKKDFSGLHFVSLAQILTNGNGGFSFFSSSL
jgi:hypothetical protein